MAKQKRERRGRGEGGIRELPDGRWQGRLSFIDGNGKRKRPVVYAATKAELLRKMAPIAEKVSKGDVVDDGGMTVGALLDQWLMARKGEVEPNTYRGYAFQAEGYLKPALGRVRLSKLKKAHVAEMYGGLAAKGVSAGLRRRVGITLTTALNYAVKVLGVIDANPASAVKKPKAAKAEMKYLTPAQARSLLDAAKGDRLYALWAVCLSSGAGPGELWALTWRDVAEDFGSLTIVKSLEEIDGRHRVKATKTAGRRRRVALSSFASEALRLHKAIMQEEGNYREDGVVFCDSQGGYLRRSNVIRNDWAPLLKKAGLPRVRLYDTRHSCATMLLAAGESVKAVSERLGHASAKMTLDVYTHAVPGLQEQAAKTLDRLIT